MTTLSLPTLASGGLLAYAATAVLTVVTILLLLYSRDPTRPHRGIPVVGGKGPWEFSNKQVNFRFLTQCKALIEEGLSKYNGPFQVISAYPLIILPPRYVGLIKDHPNLSFPKSAEKRLFGSYPGLDWASKINEDRIFQDTLRMDMTQYLSQATPALAEECNDLLDEFLPKDNADWVEYVFGKDAPRMAARLSTLVFLGKKFCRNDAWIDIAIKYPMDVIGAIRALRAKSSWLRPFVWWSIPQVAQLQNHANIARKVIGPELAARKKLRDASKDGKLEEYNDVVEWYNKHSISRNRNFDIPSAMIGLAFASTHTTAHLLTNAVYDLAAYPIHIEPLRKEVLKVLEEDHGWKKTTLYKMKLMDSFLKESQRMSPVQLTAMNRYVEKETILEDGTCLPKGALMAIALTGLRDERIFEDPDKFDGFRFAKMRDAPGQENQWQFASTRNDYYAFGHGQFSCPGRFLVANELKLFLAELILRYDIKFADGQSRPGPIIMATENIVDPSARILFKLR